MKSSERPGLGANAERFPSDLSGTVPATSPWAFIIILSVCVHFSGHPLAFAGEGAYDLFV